MQQKDEEKFTLLNPTDIISSLMEMVKGTNVSIAEATEVWSYGTDKESKFQNVKEYIRLKRKNKNLVPHNFNSQY